jgi:hypothetical protein
VERVGRRVQRAGGYDDGFSHETRLWFWLHAIHPHRTYMCVHARGGMYMYEAL